MAGFGTGYTNWSDWQQQNQGGQQQTQNALSNYLQKQGEGVQKKLSDTYKLGNSYGSSDEEKNAADSLWGQAQGDQSYLNFKNQAQLNNQQDVSRLLQSQGSTGYGKLGLDTALGGPLADLQKGVGADRIVKGVINNYGQGLGQQATDVGQRMAGNAATAYGNANATWSQYAPSKGTKSDQNAPSWSGTTTEGKTNTWTPGEDWGDSSKQVKGINPNDIMWGSTGQNIENDRSGIITGGLGQSPYGTRGQLEEYNRQVNARNQAANAYNSAKKTNEDWNKNPWTSWSWSV